MEQVRDGAGKGRSRKGTEQVRDWKGQGPPDSLGLRVGLVEREGGGEIGAHRRQRRMFGKGIVRRLRSEEARTVGERGNGHDWGED